MRTGTPDYAILLNQEQALDFFLKWKCDGCFQEVFWNIGHQSGSGFNGLRYKMSSKNFTAYHTFHSIFNSRLLFHTRRKLAFYIDGSVLLLSSSTLNIWREVWDYSIWFCFEAWLFVESCQFTSEVILKFSSLKFTECANVIVFENEKVLFCLEYFCI